MYSKSKYYVAHAWSLHVISNFAELENQELLEAHFPLKEITSDYLNSSSSLRDFRARVVTIQFKLSSLFLDPISQDKFLRLIGEERYDIETDTVSITVDRCPYR